MASKTLNFFAHGLQKDMTITLIFDAPDSHRLFKDCFPVVWKVLKLKAGRHSKASIQYRPRLAFGYADIDQDNLVSADTWFEVQESEASMISRGPGQRRFGENMRNRESQLLVHKNNTGDWVDLSLGFVKGDGLNQTYTPIFIWAGVDAGSEVSTVFNSTLTAYVTRDYKEAELLRGEVEAHVLWKLKVDELDDVTVWNLVEDKATGEFSTQAGLLF